MPQHARRVLPKAASAAFGWPISGIGQLLPAEFSGREARGHLERAIEGPDGLEARGERDREYGQVAPAWIGQCRECLGEPEAVDEGVEIAMPEPLVDEPPQRAAGRRGRSRPSTSASRSSNAISTPRRAASARIEGEASDMRWLAARGALARPTITGRRPGNRRAGRVNGRPFQRQHSHATNNVA